MTKAAAWAEAVRLLDRVSLRDPERIARAYPFALSGGERQRAMIAMALSCAPDLIIADEPTTALDVTVQAKILDLLASLGAQSEMAMLLVSHDLAVVARHCRRVLVMYGGTFDGKRPGRRRAAARRAIRIRARCSKRGRVPARRAASGCARSPASRRLRRSAPIGCPFAGRCPLTIDVCRAAPLPTIEFEADHRVRCHRVDAAGRLT